MSGLRRVLSHRLAPLLLVVAATAALPGRFAGDPALLDGVSLRVKARVLSVVELFSPSQTQVVNPYYRPLYTLLQRGADFLPGGADLGERLLALGCHAFAALALFRFARALRIRRPLALGALLLFLLAPPNVTTAAWPVVGYWTLAAALTWLAAADLIEFAARGGSIRVVRAFLLAAVSLFVAETSYHLVALLPLIALAPPRAGSRRARPLLLWPLFAALALIHFKVFEAGASGLVTTAPLDRARAALVAWPHYLEGVVGGDAMTGAPLVALAAIILLALGIGRNRRRAFLALAAVAAALPFAALGHNDRYAYFAHGQTALAFVACAPRVIARLLRRRGSRPRVLPRSFPYAMGALLPVLTLAAIQLSQVGPRLQALRLAGDETRKLVRDLAPIAPKLADLDRVVFVNCPSTLRWAVYDSLPLARPADLKPLTMVSALCSRDHYFAPTRLDFAPIGRTIVVEGDDGHLRERAPDRPLGPREPLPWLFLAGAIELVPPANLRQGFALEAQLRFDELLARMRALEDPVGHVLVEASDESKPALSGLLGPLPREKLEWKLEPIPTPAGVAPPPGLFGQRLVARVEVPSRALLVAAIVLAAEDPLRRVTGDFDRQSSLFEATLDGVPTPILPAFVHGCGIVVPAGSHEVQLRARAAGGNAFVAEPPR